MIHSLLLISPFNHFIPFQHMMFAQWYFWIHNVIGTITLLNIFGVFSRGLKKKKRVVWKIQPIFKSAQIIKFYSALAFQGWQCFWRVRVIKWLIILERLSLHLRGKRCECITLQCTYAYLNETVYPEIEQFPYLSLPKMFVNFMRPGERIRNLRWYTEKLCSKEGS